MNLSKKIPVLAFLPIFLLFVSCASMVTRTQFKPYVGAKVFQGSGGAKRTLNGLDIWENGEPDCKFKVIGIIEDEVLENNGAAPGTLNVLSVASSASLAGREKRLVATAKQNGADAIVYLTSNRSFLNAGRYESNYRNQVSIIAVKYVGDNGYRLGDNRSEIESQMGVVGQTVSLDQIGIKLSPTKPEDVQAVLYRRENISIIIVYNTSRADMAITVLPKNSLNDDGVARLLNFFSDGHAWNKVASKHPELPMEWERTDGVYFAGCSLEKGIFLVGNKQTLPIH